MKLLEWRIHKSLGAKCKRPFVKSYSFVTMTCQKCRCWVGCSANRQECYLKLGGGGTCRLHGYVVTLTSRVRCQKACDNCQGGLYCSVKKGTWQPLGTWQLSGWIVSHYVSKGTQRPLGTWWLSRSIVSHGVRQGTWWPIGMWQLLGDMTTLMC